MGGRQVKRGRVPSTAVVIPINLVCLLRLGLPPLAAKAAPSAAPWTAVRSNGAGFHLRGSALIQVVALRSSPHPCSPAPRSGLHRAWGRSGPPQGPHILSALSHTSCMCWLRWQLINYWKLKQLRRAVMALIGLVTLVLSIAPSGEGIGLW